MVPQQDGHCSVGQIVRTVPTPLGSVIAAFYNLREHEVPDQVADLDLVEERLISILFVLPGLLKSGVWKVIGEQLPRHLDRMTLLTVLEKRRFVGAEVIGGGIVRQFLDAYFGLAAWDDWADPAYLDGLLLSPDKRPVNLIFKSKDVQ